jgi:hypothetical protein
MQSISKPFLTDTFLLNDQFDWSDSGKKFGWYLLFTFLTQCYFTMYGEHLLVALYHAVIYSCIYDCVHICKPAGGSPQRL